MILESKVWEWVESGVHEVCEIQGDAVDGNVMFDEALKDADLGT